MSSFCNGMVGPFDVNITGQPIAVTGTFSALSETVVPLATGSVANVSDNVLTTVVTYTPTTAKKVTKIAVSGTNYAKVELFVNSAIIETKRMGPDRNIDFIFTNPLLLAGSVPLDVKVTHYQVGTLIDFESTVYGV
jgi:hypothetical protein